MSLISFQGFIITVGALEIPSRSIVSGAVRLCYAVVYSLFLGLGLAIGAEIHQKGAPESVVGFETDNRSDNHDPDGPWWQQTPSVWWGKLLHYIRTTIVELTLI